ncbi:hypothetical protein P3H15_49550 [Rhodococcus sp. T2V]|uniref:hypothetical protein n=1 Tax=Rhodococcus sp. T2V TaxID=3034164 RepID=UPI0023E110D3|nr:hypothetical protein [Rhodococcus sp. T2V]MDF3312973.1 hypothetical protein [Rhodococcus sp. T2V]
MAGGEVRVLDAPHPAGGRPDYGGVLGWVVDAIAGVISAHLGAAISWLDFLLDADLPDLTTA